MAMSVTTVVGQDEGTSTEIEELGREKAIQARTQHNPTENSEKRRANERHGGGRDNEEDRYHQEARE